MKKNKVKSNQSSDRDQVLIELTKKRSAVWLVILCFVSAWIFLLGILVGRGTAPVQFDINALQKELSELRHAILKKEKNLIKTDTDYLSGKTDFDFHEAFKKSKPDTDPQFTKKTPVAAAEKSMHADEKKSIPTKKQSVKIVKKSDKRESTSKKNTGVADKMLTIQVASLRDPKIADQMVNALKKRGYPAYKTIGIISENNIWYRVRAGYFKNRVCKPITFVLKRTAITTYSIMLLRKQDSFLLPTYPVWEFFMTITKDEIIHVANLARLEINEASLDKFADQIDEILEYINTLNQVDTSKVQGTSHAIALTNSFREDRVKEHLENSQALSNAPEKEDGTFVVPKIVGR